jgi:hypothetical protein
VKIKENHWLPKLIRWPIRATAITLGQTIYLAGLAADNPGTVRHEAVHTLQFQETGWVRFLAIYVWDWLRGWRLWGSPRLAYLQIRFEQEAREVARRTTLLEVIPECVSVLRKPFGWKQLRVDQWAKV